MLCNGASETAGTYTAKDLEGETYFFFVLEKALRTIVSGHVVAVVS